MTEMDISDTLAPNSDQLDAVELVGGPRTFTIERVSKGDVEQPVQIHFKEFPRPWRPGKSMRRVLVACWGADASTYAGRRVTLYCDPEVRFGGQAVGGTRVEALSHLDKPKSIPLLVSRGKSAVFIVRPLVETPETRVADPLHEQAAAMVKAFASYNVTQVQLETRIGRTIGDWTPSDLADLKILGGSLKRGELRVEDELPLPATDSQLRDDDPDLQAGAR